MVPLRLRPSEPPTPSTPHTTTSFQQFIHGINILNSSGRTQQQSSKRRSSEACQRFPSLFPVLPNPFDHIHPALRLPTSTPSTIHPAVASPASTRTRFSAMASNPFLARSSFFTRRAEAPTVLDYGGNVPIETAGSRQGTDIGIFASGDESRREWPAPSGRRRRRTKTRRRKSQKTSAPILFPAMQSRRVRAKMLQSLILGSILVMLLITYLALTKVNANLNTFQIVFVLMFILLAIALSHCLLRLFLLIRRWNIRQLQRGEKESIYNPRNHAIPVILARDEEIGISGSTADDDNDDDNGREMEAAQTVAPPPPAYGLWRGSVRADPNLLHWQRVSRHTEPSSPVIPVTQAPRPPSYTPPMQHSPRAEGGFF